MFTWCVPFSRTRICLILSWGAGRRDLNEAVGQTHRGNWVRRIILQKMKCAVDQAATKCGDDPVHCVVVSN